MNYQTESAMYLIRETASFHVDAMKTFTPLCPDELPVPGGHEIVPALLAQDRLARFKVGSKDAHPEDAVHVATPDAPQFSPVIGHPEVDIRWNRHARPGTDGFRLLDGLPKPINYDFFVYKGVEPDQHPYGACYHTLNWRVRKQSTGVIEWMKVNDVKNVIVGGLALDFCVKNTALQLRDAGFNVIINLAACRGISEKTIAEALEEMRAAGVVVVEDVSACDLFVAGKVDDNPAAKLPSEFKNLIGQALTGKTTA
jgi:nicotinamidase/pyrazinamidase